MLTAPPTVWRTPQPRLHNQFKSLDMVNMVSESAQAGLQHSMLSPIGFSAPFCVRARCL